MSYEPDQLVTKGQQRNASFAAAFLALVAVGALISFTLWYVSHERRVSDQRWCALLTSFDERYQRLPPDADPNGKVLAQQIRELRGSLYCPPGSLPTVAPSKETK